jgi:hypothetical protein
VIIQEIGVAAGTLGAEEGAYLAARHEQCFIDGGRWRLRVLRVPAYANAPLRGGPLCASSAQSPLTRELRALRLTAGTVRDDPQVTRWQAVRTRPVDCAGAVPSAGLR